MYIYLDAVYRVAVQSKVVGRAKAMCRAALKIQHTSRRLRLESFAVAIFCSSPEGAVDDKTGSKWSRAMRGAERPRRRVQPAMTHKARSDVFNKAAFCTQLARHAEAVCRYYLPNGRSSR